MKIKYHYNFSLRTFGRKTKRHQIRLRFSYNGLRGDIVTGWNLDSAEAWDAELQKVVKGYVGSHHETSADINSDLQVIAEQLEMVFRYFEVNDIMPTTAMVMEKFEERMKGSAPKRPATEVVEKEKKSPRKEKSLFEAFDLFTQECGEKNAWTNSTFEKMQALKNDLLNYNKSLKFSDLNEPGLVGFVAYLRDNKKLRTPRKGIGERKEYDDDDIIGLKNSTIEKKLGYLRWFMNWATNKGINKNLVYKTFKPTLKSTQKKVIYLTKEELEKVRKLKLPEDKAYLDPVRDIFLFCCFSGLRHSDVANLRKNDVKGDHIEITTVKTADSISIELNNITKDILAKYKDVKFPNNLALPSQTNQAMNRNLKELCKLAGLDEEIRITTYKGNERHDEFKKKWELVGTHTGRRTFIVQALSLGIPPNIVMKWTGHADYKSMRPYIDIVNSIKSESMKKFDGLL